MADHRHRIASRRFRIPRVERPAKHRLHADDIKERAGDEAGPCLCRRSSFAAASHAYLDGKAAERSHALEWRVLPLDSLVEVIGEYFGGARCD